MSKTLAAYGRVIVAAGGLAMALASPALAQPAGAKLDHRPRTAIITAFEPEWRALEGAVVGPRRHKINGLTILTGQMAGRSVILLQSGVSMVNAAMNTQLVIDRFHVRRIVFSGIAGGVDPALAIGDVVVPARWNQYLEVALGRQQGDRYISPDLEENPDPLPAYGMMIPRDVRVGNASEPARRHRWFMADAALLRLAAKVTGAMHLARCLPNGTPQNGATGQAGQCLDHQPRIMVGGQGISGPAFADNAEYREYLHATFKAQVLDMETAATAHVAYANQVPFIAFRSLSDLAGGDAGPNQSWVFGQLAARNAAQVVRSFVAALPKDQK